MVSINAIENINLCFFFVIFVYYLVCALTIFGLRFLSDIWPTHLRKVNSQFDNIYAVGPDIIKQCIGWHTWWLRCSKSHIITWECGPVRRSSILGQFVMRWVWTGIGLFAWNWICAQRITQNKTMSCALVWLIMKMKWAVVFCLYEFLEYFIKTRNCLINYVIVYK